MRMYMCILCVYVEVDLLEDTQGCPLCNFVRILEWRCTSENKCL